jgi:protein TonB
MFETSVVRTEAQTASRASLLTMSLLAHSAVVIGIVAASIITVDFPTNAPDEFGLAPEFMPVRIPPPLGNPNGGAPKPQQPKVAQNVPPPQPNVLTAPQQIPNEVPNVAAASSSTNIGTNTDPNATSTEPLGVPWGTKDSIGDLDAPPAPITNATPVEEKIYEAHEVKAPVLIRRVDPPYPSHLVKTRMNALVVVRCIIDKNGHVREPQILKPALPPFNAAVLAAVQQWRYTPGSRNGIAVETYLNVSVTFSVN